MPSIGQMNLDALKNYNSQLMNHIELLNSNNKSAITTKRVPSKKTKKKVIHTEEVSRFNNNVVTNEQSEVKSSQDL